MFWLCFSANIVANLQWTNEHSVRCKCLEQVRLSETKQCEQGRGSDIFVISQVYPCLWESMGRWINIWDVYLLRDVNLDSGGWPQERLWAGNWWLQFSKTHPSEHSLSRAGWVRQEQSDGQVMLCLAPLQLSWSSLLGCVAHLWKQSMKFISDSSKSTASTFFFDFFFFFLIMWFQLLCGFKSLRR